MASPLLIGITDFPAFVPITLNVGNHLIDPHINAAQVFDVRGLFTATEWAGFERNLGSTAPEFPGLEFDTAEFLATPPASGWDDNRLAALWAGFVRPVLVLESFRRFLTWHGTHVTENGVESFSDGANIPISGPRRAELKAEAETQCTLYRARLTAALRVYRGAAAGTACAKKRHPYPNRGGFSSHAL